MVKGYGWVRDLPDHRDLLFPQSGVTAPRKFDLWEHYQIVPIWDQGQQGSCTGHGVARIAQHQAQREGRAFGEDRVSPAFIYYNERVIEGDVGQDNGAQVRDGVKSLAQSGYALESECPYSDTHLTTGVSPKAVSDAAERKATAYRSVVPGGGRMLQAVSQGLPIVFGFSVPDFFEDESRWDPISQVLPLPSAADGFIGGHCVVVTGYDFTVPVPYFWCDNSWGQFWGVNGRFRMDARYFAAGLATDPWVVSHEE